MEVRIQSLNFEATEKLQSFIQKKVQKLERFYDNIAQVEVVLKVVKPETSKNKEAGIKVFPSSGGEFYANKICDSFEQAVDESLLAIERQLVKHKEKQRNL
ncbi:MAG: ribosome-associated translation inhibitor RaiA [Bacteroidales bacterium]|nr:ribosome-associated translation inhibitor RaiA [Bacteroidales bacterium]